MQQLVNKNFDSTLMNFGGKNVMAYLGVILIKIWRMVLLKKMVLSLCMYAALRSIIIHIQ